MKKFGTISGVFIPAVESILGVVLFLILPGLVLSLGFLKTALVILLANSITLATAFSISDIATSNPAVGKGGMYVLSKNSLGIAFGGAIGIQLYLAQSVSIAFYAAGCIEGIYQLMAMLLPEVSGVPPVMIQIGSTAFLIILLIITLMGADFVISIQKFVFIALVVSIAVLIASPLLIPTRAGGEALFNTTALITVAQEGIPFWLAFAIFFPAVTGIDAGIGMSGLLKDPSRSLVRGTFAAIFITAVVYLLSAYVFSFIDPVLFAKKGNLFAFFADYPFFLVILALGVFVSTFSSAIAYFLTAPQTGQAIARDRLLPKRLSFLSADFVKGGKLPRWATVCTFLLAISVVWMGNLSFISLIVGICFLTVYAWVNLAAVMERISGNPSFRPTSPGHWAVSFFGFLACIMIIILYNWLVGLAVIGIQSVIFALLLRYRSRRKMDGIWWGLLFSHMTTILRVMRRNLQGSKNWRPIVALFAFADTETESRQIIRIGESIASYKGMVLRNLLFADTKSAFTQNNNEYDYDRNVFANFHPVYLKNASPSSTILSIVQNCLPGGLSINTVLLKLDARFELLNCMQQLVTLHKNVLLYKKGAIGSELRIDVWWRGDKNGSLMLLVAHMIRQTELWVYKRTLSISLVRKLDKDEDAQAVERELANTIQRHRVIAKPAIVPYSKEDIYTSLNAHSNDANLIVWGMPELDNKPLLSISKEQSYQPDIRTLLTEFSTLETLPPVLFVKSSNIV